MPFKCSGIEVDRWDGLCRCRHGMILLWCVFGIVLCTLFVGRAGADGLPFGVNLIGEHLSHPDLVSGLGAVWTRTSVSWAAVEPSNTTPDNYQWTSVDRNFSALEALGLKPIVIVWKNPSWAATTSCGPITDTANFAEFAGALAERYDGDGDYDGDGYEDGLVMPNVTHWEFYNEPDCYDDENDGYPDDFVGEWLGGCWGSNGAEYAQMLAVVWEAMHAANEETVVLLGALAAEPTPPFNFSLSGGDFLDDVLEYIDEHPGDYFDWMGSHYYYPYGAWWWNSYGRAILGKAEYFRQRLEGHGLTKPVAFTEVGMRSDKEHVGMPLGFEGQSRFLVQAMVQSASGGIRATTWYKMRDEPVQKWGLLDINYEKNPSYGAYETLTRELGGATPAGEVSLGDGLEGYEFDLPGGGVRTVLWSTDEVIRTVSFAGSLLRVADKYGLEVQIGDGGPGDVDGTVNGEVSFEINGSPDYVDVLVGVTPTPTSTPTNTPTPTSTPTSTATPEPTVTPHTTIVLHVGMNLISVPVSPNSSTLSDVLASVEGRYDKLYAYDASNASDPWKRYSVGVPSYANDLTEIDSTMGFWILATEPVALTVSGSKPVALTVLGSVPSSTDISLYSGWNLVGYPSQTTRPIAEALGSIDTKYDLIYAYHASDTADPWKKYNPAAPSFLNDLVEMEPGWGYWIRVSEDCTWSVP